MKHLAWLTDVHPNFLRPPVLGALLAHSADTEADAFLLGGDVVRLPTWPATSTRSTPPRSGRCIGPG